MSVVNTFVSIVLPNCTKGDESVDKVHLYATEVLTLGLLWHGYHDAIKEGDGDRVYLYWKFLLLAFKQGHRFNYSSEAINLLIQAQCLLSPREAAQLKWCRFVNTQGRVGCNIASDLQMEHLNRQVKTVLGANVNSSAIKRAGKSISVVSNVSQTFE